MLRKKFIIGLLIFAVGLFAEGIGIYIHAAPAIPLSQDWVDYVNSYPAWEAGLTLEIPTHTVFSVRVEATYVELPPGGALDDGRAFYGGLGALTDLSVSAVADVVIGPQIIFGLVQAKGRYQSIEFEEDSEEYYYVDYDGEGFGFGIGMLGGIKFALSEHLRTGANLSVTYFSVIDKTADIQGFNYDQPGGNPQEGTYRYEGEYMAISFRLTFGYEF